MSVAVLELSNDVQEKSVLKTVDVSQTENGTGFPHSHPQSVRSAAASRHKADFK